MKTALYSIAMLEKDQISNINCHTMVGNGTFASFFNSLNAFNYSNFCSPESVQPAIQTGQYSMSSLGYALHEIGSAMRFATEARQMVFEPVLPDLQVLQISYDLQSHDAVYGWHFKDVHNNEQMIIINMSHEEVSIDLSSAGNITEPQ
jgi:hypothetical protein